MDLNPFQAYQIAMELSPFAFGRSKLLGVYASSDIKIYPFQMAAALFALRSPYLKGVILCDKGGLGKTAEALLAMAQRWHEGKRRILIITPNHLLSQWETMLNEKFSVPWTTLHEKEKLNKFPPDINPFLQNAVILTSYDFALENSERIKEIVWDTIVFEKASRLSKIYAKESREAELLKEAAGSAFKILVTPTPIETSIMDIYGLIYFINEAVLPEREWFYKRYFRKPENYGELSDRISRYCFRTLRIQAKRFMKLTNRIPVTVKYSLTEKEKKLYSYLESYLKRPVKKAFPQMDSYELNLMLTKIASSSSYALNKTLTNIEKRLKAVENCEEELSEIRKMIELSEEINENAKGKELLFLLKKLFPVIKKAGGKKKALIFTENLITQKYLKKLLAENGYSVLLYNGTKSKDYEILRQFETTAEILICTEVAASGLNLQFCSFVINYDWSYNALEMEQRINRCHRQEQENDVIVINFINPDNFADVRIIELMNKRMRQFDGIVGMSDDIVGEFFSGGTQAVEYIAKTIRPSSEIEKEHREILEQAKEENIKAKEPLEEQLFTTFDERIAEHVKIEPQYIEEKVNEINNQLWDLTRYFLKGNKNVVFRENTRSVIFSEPRGNIFTGVYIGRNEYSMLDKSLPKSGRHTITGSLSRNIIKEILWRGIQQEGKIVVRGELEKCLVGFYEITVNPAGNSFSEQKYTTLAGVTEKGEKLTEKECLNIMRLPVLDCQPQGLYHRGKYGEQESKRNVLDSMIDIEIYLNRAAKELTEEASVALEDAAIVAEEERAALNHREVESVNIALKTAKKAEPATKMEAVKVKKQINTLIKELKQKQQSVFMEELRIDAKKEQRIKEIKDQLNLKASVKRIFLLRFEGQS